MTDTHDHKMRDVYAHIYQDRYAFKPEVMAAVSERILKNLTEFSIRPEDLAGMNVLNVGPSREALVLHRLGARKVFHFDISDLAVGALQRAKAESPALDNLQTVLRDLSAPGLLPVAGGIDFVYLSGVLHHLHDPVQAMANIFPHLNPAARLYFRIYRSGSMAFFCGDFVRHFISYDDRDTVEQVFRRLRPEFNAADKVLYDDLWDNFFVPVQSLFDPVAVNRFFEAHGFAVAVRGTHVAYDHGNARPDSQGVSLYYRRTGAPLGAVDPGSFPGSVNQMTDITYREDYIRESVRLMQAFLAKAPELAPEARAEAAIEVYRHGQLRRLKAPVSAEEQHRKIQAVLAAYL